jgi:hypothetical protein
MCQPGLPGPQGLSHVGSPGLAAFQSTKSKGLRLRSSTATRSPALLSSWGPPSSTTSAFLLGTMTLARAGGGRVGG